MSQHSRKMLPPGETRKRKDREAEGICSKSNGLLAGYMAYEFLTKGTLFGHAIEDPTQPSVSLSLRKEKEKEKEHRSSYGEVATILKTDGTHIPGIVNPSQLSAWIRIHNITDGVPSIHPAHSRSH